MSNARQFVWSSADRSHVGMVRKINEDACLALPDLGLWAVADGMGGHEAGEVASQMIIDALRQVPGELPWEAFIAAVQAQLQSVNERLREESNRRYQQRTIGSTVAILLAKDDQCACLWAGDSRIYRLRNNQLQQLTRDHSHVQELVDQGLIDPDQAHDHPLGNVITRAVGSAEALEVDVRIQDLQASDVFLLCSDGLNKAVTDAEIARLLNVTDNHEVVQSLIHLALVRGASDNVTTIVVRVAE
ncbi:MAG: serine/threonine-protein phosphatase [Gammaproteobacteria bacterium]|nr:serine/threonine-protein phosphatase [Gammaproteobacteria bacterium]MCP5425226.1 serine/threonine-protein phosphatase [Gammaproteobacteria bacterium]MCP5459620.1 serine/threonine-protein phosphatase [Gammaproteobacteria bacterium]